MSEIKHLMKENTKLKQ